MPLDHRAINLPIHLTKKWNRRAVAKNTNWIHRYTKLNRSSNNQIEGVLSRIFIHSHCKARSHNPKGGCACREKIKRIPDFNHTYCVQCLNITTSQNSITEKGNRLNNLYWYKAIARCTHLVARILQHVCKFSSEPKVIKISNQAVHHQSATKFASLLQDIKKLPACDTAKIPTAFLILRKKKNNY